MVFQLQSQRWRRPAFLAFLGFALATCYLTTSPVCAADRDYLDSARSFYLSGDYYQAARYAFNSSDSEGNLGPEAYALITMSLKKAGLHHSATYFFIQTLQTRNSGAIRSVLKDSEDYLLNAGGDFIGKYLIRYTSEPDYESENKNAFLFSQGEQALLEGKAARAVSYFDDVESSSGLWPFTLQMRATAHAISGNAKKALADYQSCQNAASRLKKARQEDLESRCLAGEARVLYEMGRFEEAEEAYDRIQKSSFVWTDTVFEQAWNSFAEKQYNRTLGKLVTYKNPLLDFVFNPEVDVLRAQTYLVLCLYSDANQSINEFNSKYSKIAERIKKFVDRNANHLPAFYQFGKRSLRESLHADDDIFRVMNRFIRSPYFSQLYQAEQDISTEWKKVQTLSDRPNEGFGGFLKLVLTWKRNMVRSLGGAFVKNSLMDYHSALLSDFDKVSFIKLEMLKRAKEKLLSIKTKDRSRDRGNVIPDRKDYQYYWNFNGEFWIDELGDYVFGLESACSS